MAGEKRGKTYEALLKVALDDLKNAGIISGNVYWNETPAGLTVEPDFLIGPDKDHPEIIFLVTHSNAPKKSPIKTWRNLGELCEIKSVLFPVPKAVNVVFDSVIEENLKTLQESIFDAQLVVGDKAYGYILKKWVVQADKQFPADQFEKAKAIELELTRNPVLYNAFTQMFQDLSECLEKSNTALVSLWELERSRARGKAPIAKSTFVRRGLSKLLVFDDIEAGIKLYREGNIPQGQIAEFVVANGFAKSAIGNIKPSDSEIQGAIAALSDEEIAYLYHSCDENEVVQGLVSQLRSVSNIEVMLEYVEHNYDKLCDSQKLYESLQELYDHPEALVAAQSFNKGIPPHNVWLFDILLEVIKTDSGKTNGYGHAKLAEDVSDPSGPAGHFGEETRHFLLSPWGHLSDWTGRTDKASIPDDVIAAVSDVLSFKLKSIGHDRLQKLSTNVIKSYTHNLIESKLCTYNGFAPLLLLMLYHEVGSEENLEKITSCFAEKGNLPGRTGENTVLHINNTFINWQTATDSGRDHKRKELSGRAVGLRYTWDSDKEKFVERPGVKKLILLLDGTWRQKDMDALIAAGWDEIYYPDEIDKLKAAIV